MHRAGADGVAANPPHDKVDGDRACQCQYSPLARAIGQTTVNTDSGCDRGHVDDHASAGRLCQHLPNRFACTKEDTACIHVHDTLPVLQTGLQNIADMALTSIVDQDIEPTFGSSNPLYRGLDLRLLSHIELLGARTPSRSLNFAD